MIWVAATAGLVVAMVLALVRALLGPTVYDRILALNAFGTKTVLIIAVLGFLGGRPDFMDIALLYALINFVGTIAVLKCFRYGHLGIEGGRQFRRRSPVQQQSDEIGEDGDQIPPPVIYPKES